MKVQIVAVETETLENVRIDMQSRVSSAGIRLDLNGDKIVSLLMSPEEVVIMIHHLSQSLLNNQISFEIG